MLYDVVIVGGGPAGLSAALALGRARKRVLLCDAGPRRNAAAVHIHNFVTRDGTPPEEFRQIGREQLAEYRNVEVRATSVAGVSGARGAFRVQLADGSCEARRVLLATGMVDTLPSLEGLRELWGSAVFQCPYCHGWEVKGRRWGYLVSSPDWSHVVPFGVMLRAWTRDVMLFVSEGSAPPEASRGQLEAAGVRIEPSPIKRLVAHGQQLESVELASGARVACDVLFTHPPQRQVALVQASGVALDDDGFVQVDPMRRETSVPGIYAAGDLATRMQGAVLAAAAGVQAAAMLNMELTMELAVSGSLDYAE